MTVIRPNSISGITSITAQANEINMFRSDGTLAGLQINGINFNNTSGISTLAALNVTGNVSIAGTLTYEDVTNIDSVGVITARSGINVSGGGVDITTGGLVVTGISTTTARLDVGNNGTNAVDLRFRSNRASAGQTIANLNYEWNGTTVAQIRGIAGSDTTNKDDGHLAFYTTPAGSGSFSERLRISSSGKVNIGDNQTSQNILNIEDGTAASMEFASHGTGGDTAYIGVKKSTGGGLTFGISNRDIIFKTGASYSGGTAFDGGTERLRIGSNGFLTVTTTGQGSGIRLVDSSTSSGSPNLEIISKRQDANNNTAFSSNIFLGKNRTDQKVTSGIRLGTINFGGNHTDGTETNISYSASIQGIASDSFDSKSDMPTDLIFTTGTSGTDRDGEAAGQSNVGTERLRINSRGAVTKPDLPSFNARPPASYSLGDNVNAVVGGTWSTSGTGSFVRGTLANGNSIWNNTNGIFTVPVTGIYFLHWTVFLSNNSTRRDAYIYLNGTGNGNIIARTEIQDDGSGMNKSVAVSTVLSLSVNDTVRFGARTAGGTTIYQTAAPWSYACGHLIG